MAVIKLHKKNINIDDEMVLVVKELNRLGLKTVSCCCGHYNPEKPNKSHMAQLAFDIKDVAILIDNGIISINWKREK